MYQTPTIRFDTTKSNKSIKSKTRMSQELFCQINKMCFVVTLFVCKGSLLCSPRVYIW